MARGNVVHPDKDVHYDAEVGDREEEIVEGVVKEANELLEECIQAREIIKKKVEDAVSRFGENERLQNLKHQWNSALAGPLFSDVPISVNNNERDADVGASSSRHMETPRRSSRAKKKQVETITLYPVKKQTKKRKGV